MPILMLKSILSLIMVFIALVQMFFMFEVFGRSEKRFNVSTLKKLHRINGVLFILLYFYIAYYCLEQIINSKEELSPRVNLHALLSFSVIIILALKISFIRIYRQFYQKALTLGPLVALLTFGMMATSGGYYFLVTLF